jgi:hypothetical protein
MTKSSRKLKIFTANEMEVFCYSNSAGSLMETARGLKTIFKLMDTRYFSAALLRTIPVSYNSTFLWGKCKLNRLLHIYRGPLNGLYSMPDELILFHRNTGLFIRPSGISEIDCAKTKTDRAERSISVGIESLPSFFCTRRTCRFHR